MPFKSEQQRKFLWAAHPAIAKRWAHEYPNPKNLPKRVSDTPEQDKQAHSAPIITPEYVNNLLTSVIFQASSEKQGNSGIKLNIPHSEKPVAAGDEHVTTGNKRRDKQRQDGSASIERLFGLGEGKKAASSGAPEYCVNPLLLKLAVVLSQPIQQALADEQAQQQGQQAQKVPANGGLQPLTTPLSANPLPLGAQQQAQPPQPGQPAQQVPIQPPQQVPVQPAPQDGQPKTAKLAGPLKPMSMPKPAAPTSQAPPVQPAEAVPPAPAMPAQKPIPPLKPLGGGSNPSANPINAFGPISMSGDINGNAALGAPGAGKMAAAGILKIALTKWALDVTKGGLGSRALASTIGHVGAFPMMTIMSPRSHVNPNQWAGPNGSYLTSNIGEDDTRAQKLIELAKAMKSKNPEELKDHRVYLGGGDFFRELPRIFTNPRTSIAGKALGALTHPLNTLMPALTRGSIYNPFTNSTYLMGDKPSVLTHELGHAIDFNSGEVPQYSDKENPASTWLKRQGSGLKHDLYTAGRSVPLYGAFHALHQEEQANTLSANNLRKAFKHNPKALNKILDERQRILPAGMGSYAGNAAAALTSPILGPAGYMIMPTAGMLAGKAWGESESQRRDGKYVRETKQKKKPEKKKDDKEQDDDRQEPRRKAAQAVPK